MRCGDIGFEMTKVLQDKTPRDILRIVYRRKRLFLLGTALFAIVAMLVARYIPVRYTGTAIFERRTDIAAGHVLEKEGESFETIKLTLQHELAGRHAVEQVAEELGLLRGLPRDSQGNLTIAGEMAKQDIVRKLMDNVKIKWKVRSRNLDLISVSATHSDPRLAQEIPNALVRNYINKVSEQIVQRLMNSREFLLEQVSKSESRLKEALQKKIAFETKHAGMLPESPGALYERIQRIDDNISVLEKQEKSSRMKVARLKSQLSAMGAGATTQPIFTNSTSQPTTQETISPQTTTLPVEYVQEPNPERKRLEDQLRQFEEQLSMAITINHMTDNHPTVKTLKSKIAELKERIKKMPEWVVARKTFRLTNTPLSRQLAVQMIMADISAAISELEAIEREKERLLKRRKSLEQLMVNFAPVRQEYDQILEKIDKDRRELEYWQKRLSEVQIALAAEAAKRRTHLNAVQLAQKQIRPSFPSLWMVLGFAVIGGLAFGGGLVFAANALDRTISTTDEAIEQFNVPVHGVISEIITHRQRIMNRIKKWVVGPIITLLILMCLAAAAMNIILWLRYPQYYASWKASPIGFIYHRVTETILPALSNSLKR